MKMEIHQLKYVVAVDRYRSFSKAADNINVAQSALSNQIKKLENELGIVLFERTTRAVQPTVAGMDFISYAKNILNEIEAAKQCMDDYSGLMRGNVNIGAIRTVEDMGFISLIAAFHKKYPDLKFNIIQEGSYKIIDMIRKVELDVGIAIPPFDDLCQDMQIFPLIQEEFILVTAKDHWLSGRIEVSLKELADEDFIFPISDQCIYSLSIDACKNAGFDPKIVCHCSHSETSLALVGSGMGIGFFTSSSISNDQLDVSVTRIKETFFKQIALILPKKAFLSPATIAFRDFILGNDFLSTQKS
jgi:LysR family hydrogen peroxide-inducible transcriptional activator